MEKVAPSVFRKYIIYAKYLFLWYKKLQPVNPCDLLLHISVPNLHLIRKCLLHSRLLRTLRGTCVLLLTKVYELDSLDVCQFLLPVACVLWADNLHGFAGHRSISLPLEVSHQPLQGYFRTAMRSREGVRECKALPQCQGMRVAWKAHVCKHVFAYACLNEPFPFI